MGTHDHAPLPGDQTSAPVLIVDAEPMARKSLSAAVQSAGAEAVTAADSDEALTAFRRLGSPLVFVDANLPGLGGLGLARTVKRIAPETSVVLMARAGNPEIEAHAHGLGAVVLQKPLRFGDVRAVVSQTLGATPGLAGRAPLLTESARMETVVSLARRIARTEASVLIQGETGTGKELLARLIHDKSARAVGPFVAVNCSALPETLIESELFGHERGAFTGAAGRRAGRFEVAAGGTLVLDEVTEIPLSVQAKLLRALQEREVDRVGSSHSVKVDVRVIAIANHDLRAEVQAGRFRQDLFYRLNVVSLHLPPLRARAGDIPLLARHFLRKHAEATGGCAEGFTAEAMERLLAHPWPGNIRELENVIQRALILCPDREIGQEHVALEEHAAPALVTPGRTVMDVERDLILATLKSLNGNRTHAAKALGVSVRTIRNRLREYRLVAPGAVC